MGVAGFTCVLKQTGEPVAMTDEPCSLFSVSGVVASYYVTNSAKRMIDPDTTLQAFDNGTPIAIANLSHSSGLITFTPVPGGPVTVTGNYLPQFEVAEAHEFELNFSRQPLEKTTMDPATVAKTRIVNAGSTAGSLREVSGVIKTRDDLLTDLGDGTTPFADFDNGPVRLLEVAFPSGGVFRGFVRLTGISQSTGFDGLLESTIEFQSTIIRGVNATSDISFAFPVSTF